MKALNFEDFLTEQLLLEVGEGNSKSYDYKFIKDFGTITAEFETEEDKYVVIFSEYYDEDEDKQVISADFGIKGMGVDYNVVTNKGRLFRIMSTIVNILKDFIKKYPEYKDFIVSPTKNSDTDMRRSKLYLAFIKKNLKKGKVNVLDNGDITIEL